MPTIIPDQPTLRERAEKFLKMFYRDENSTLHDGVVDAMLQFAAEVGEEWKQKCIGMEALADEERSKNEEKDMRIEKLCDTIKVQASLNSAKNERIAELEQDKRIAELEAEVKRLEANLKCEYCEEPAMMCFCESCLKNK